MASRPLVPLASADYVVCSGLFDDTTETPQDYVALIAAMRERGLTMVCANPDIVVERGDKLVYCAGAIADLYAAAGGDVLYAGKPYRPIYERSLAVARSVRGQETAPARLLAIGDFDPHRPERGGGVGDRFPVRDRRHPCRGARRARATRCGGAERYLHGRRPRPQGRHATPGLVGLEAGALARDQPFQAAKGGVGSSGNTAAILPCKVCALNGLTM